MAPVILAAIHDASFETHVLATGQHTDMLHQALRFFGLKADTDLSIMKENQTLDYITASVLEKTGNVFDSLKPDMILVHGDTTTTMAAALAGFYRKIPVAHVEAGLRSGSFYLPFPEEMNRVVADRLSTLWFPPTVAAKEALLREGADPERVVVTGNTVIDALLWAVDKTSQPVEPALLSIPDSARVILVTAHRRESWGRPLVEICRAVLDILESHQDIRAVLPMHKNPRVRNVIKNILGGDERVILCEPLDYPDMVWAMKRSSLILTDSGGIQEETTVLDIPTLVMRDVTERPEAVEYGTAFMVGADRKMIVQKAGVVLSGKVDMSQRSRRIKPPFGDGDASEKILDRITSYLTTGTMQ